MDLTHQSEEGSGYALHADLLKDSERACGTVRDVWSKKLWVPTAAVISRCVMLDSCLTFLVPVSSPLRLRGMH